MQREVKLWLWRYVDESGRRRVTSYRLTEADARARLRDPVPVAGSLEIRTPSDSTSSFLASKKRADDD